MSAINLNDYPHVVFFTGAGMSAESGVPTYRGRGGIWHQYNYEDYACQRAFDRDPQKVLDFHELRRSRVLECAPHAGHLHLAKLQVAHSGIAVITQNIDGLLQRAGVQVEAELHGSMWRLRCECGTREDAGNHSNASASTRGAFATRRCAHCEAWLRPDITWFEDAVDQTVFEHAARLIQTADLFVGVGTSGVVWPAAGFAEAARAAGARMIEVNREETEASALYNEHVRKAASQAIAALFRLPD